MEPSDSESADGPQHNWNDDTNVPFWTVVHDALGHDLPESLELDPYCIAASTCVHHDTNSLLRSDGELENVWAYWQDGVLVSVGGLDCNDPHEAQNGEDQSTMGANNGHGGLEAADNVILTE